MLEDDFCGPVISFAGYRDLKETAMEEKNVVSFDQLAERHRKLFERGHYSSDRECTVIYLASRRLALKGAKFI